MPLSSPRRLVGLSTKMYFDHHQTHTLVQNIITHLQEVDPSVLSTLDIFIIPDFLSILDTNRQIQASKLPIWVGAQDCHWEDKGAHTGEISPLQLKQAGVNIVEIGHAERRRAGETDEHVELKAQGIARNGMVPLVCIGEKTRGTVYEALEACLVQIEAVVNVVDVEDEIVLAYEPVWAIGADQPATAEYVKDVVRGIKELNCLQNRLKATRVIYGGSAGSGLFMNLHQPEKGVDGLFLGRFGHDPETFVKTLLEVAGAEAKSGVLI